MTTVYSVTLAELNDPTTGRLDARRVAEYLHIPLSHLAAALGKKYHTVHKTPAALSLQPGLLPIKRSLDILARVFRDDAMVRIWLNSPHPDLGLRTPMQVILEGHAAAVETILANAIEGIPT
jgi:hypothetical protein